MVDGTRKIGGIPKRRLVECVREDIEVKNRSQNTQGYFLHKQCDATRILTFDAPQSRSHTQFLTKKTRLQRFDKERDFLRYFPVACLAFSTLLWIV